MQPKRKKKQAAEECARQKQLARERQEKNEKDRREFEQAALAYIRAGMQGVSLGEYSFFRGCMTLDQLESRYDQLITIFTANDSGGLALAEVIKQQYESIKRELENRNSERKAEDDEEEKH